jgi:hypothetical protein
VLLLTGEELGRDELPALLLLGVQADVPRPTAIASTAADRTVVDRTHWIGESRSLAAIVA